MKLLAFIFSAPLSAAAAESARPEVTVASTGSLLQVTFSLLLVLAVIIFIAWLLKRMNITGQQSDGLLKVISSVAIGQRERIVLIEINETWLVVGVGPGQIRTLHTLEKIEDWQPAAATDQKFSSLLATLYKPRTGSSDAS